MDLNLNSEAQTASQKFWMHLYIKKNEKYGVNVPDRRWGLGAPLSASAHR